MPGLPPPTPDDRIRVVRLVDPLLDLDIAIRECASYADLEVCEVELDEKTQRHWHFAYRNQIALEATFNKETDSFWFVLIKPKFKSVTRMYRKFRQAAGT